jgi:hypothetical protein
MRGSSTETVGVRFTGWAALHRDPLEDRVEYTCPHCGTHGAKDARRPRSEYCKRSLRVSPVVLLHDRDEQRRFNAVFLADAKVSKN